MFVSSEDLKELSGYEIPAYQIRWLSQQGLKFLVGADGKPKVLLAHLQEVMSGYKQVKRRTEPNFAAIEIGM